jgi:uridine kinase
VVQLSDYFKEAEDLQFTLNPKVLFDKTDIQNMNLLQQYLPALTTWEKVMKLKEKKAI